MIIETMVSGYRIEANTFLIKGISDRYDRMGSKVSADKYRYRIAICASQVTSNVAVLIATEVVKWSG